MTYDGIISVFQHDVGLFEVIKNNFSWKTLVWFFLGIILSFIVVTLFAVILRLFMGEEVERFTEWSKRYIVYLIIAPFMLIAPVWLMANNSASEEVDKWEKEYVMSYLEELSEKKSTEILEIKEANKGILNKSDIVKRVKVSFIDGENILDGIAEVKIDKNAKEPYVTYVVNDRDFTIKSEKSFLDGKGKYKEGKVSLVELYIPKEYKIESRAEELNGKVDNWLNKDKEEKKK